MTCSAVFGTFLTVFGALSPRMRIGDCMKCCCECHCGGISSRDALNDRLYWVEVITGPAEGTRCAAWRNDPGGKWHWVLDVMHGGYSLVYADEGVRIIHEIIPED